MSHGAYNVHDGTFHVCTGSHVVSYTCVHLLPHRKQVELLCLHGVDTQYVLHRAIVVSMRYMECGCSKRTQSHGCTNLRVPHGTL